MGKGWEAADCSVKAKLGAPPFKVQRRRAFGAASHSNNQTNMG